MVKIKHTLVQGRKLWIQGILLIPGFFPKCLISLWIIQFIFSKQERCLSIVEVTSISLTFQARLQWVLSTKSMSKLKIHRLKQKREIIHRKLFFSSNWRCEEMSFGVPFLKFRLAESGSSLFCFSGFNCAGYSKEGRIFLSFPVLCHFSLFWWTSFPLGKQWEVSPVILSFQNVSYGMSVRMELNIEFSAMETVPWKWKVRLVSWLIRELAWLLSFFFL